METKQILFYVFITFILLAIIVKSSMSQDEGMVDKMKIFKKVLIIFIIIGVLNVYNITKDVKNKILVLIFVTMLFTTFIISHSTGKYCNEIPNAYKFRLILEGGVYILLLSALIWGTTFGSIFGFELVPKGSLIDDTIGGELDEYGSITIDEVDIAINQDLDCPSESDVLNLPEETDEEQQYKQDCLDYYTNINRREELDGDVYD